MEKRASDDAKMKQLLLEASTTSMRTKLSPTTKAVIEEKNEHSDLLPTPPLSAEVEVEVSAESGSAESQRREFRFKS